MICACQSMLSANTTLFSSSHRFTKNLHSNGSPFRIRASTNNTQDDCNAEECAPDKEVGTVSLEWLAGEKTKVVGTFPPKKKGWTGYVEKDTAGQTNIYSVEPVVYVAESAISSGTAGTSSQGAENTAAIAAGLALVSVAAASSILLQVGKNTPSVQKIEYSGPSLSYYINKFKPLQVVNTSIQPTDSPSLEQLESSAPEVPQVEAQPVQEAATTPNASDVS